MHRILLENMQWIFFANNNLLVAFPLFKNIVPIHLILSNTTKTCFRIQYCILLSTLLYFYILCIRHPSILFDFISCILNPCLKNTYYRGVKDGFDLTLSFAGIIFYSCKYNDMPSITIVLNSAIDLMWFETCVTPFCIILVQALVRRI